MAKWALDAEERLRVLDELGLYPGVADEAFDCYTRLVSRLLDTPVALVSLVSTDRQFFPSSLGLPEPWATRAQTPLSMSFCQHVVTGNDVLAVTDAPADSRVGDNLAIDELGVQAYLGVPLRAPTGEPLGSLCAIDTHPRQWTDDNLANLRDIADAVAAMVGLRLSEHRQRQDANEASHRLRTPLAALRFELEDATRSAEVGDDVLAGLEAAIGHVDHLAGIVDDLLAVIRTRGRLDESMVDLTQLIGDVASAHGVLVDLTGPVRLHTVPLVLRHALDVLLGQLAGPGVVIRVVPETRLCRIQVIAVAEPDDAGTAATDWTAAEELVHEIGGRLAATPGPPLVVELALPLSGPTAAPR